MTALAEKLKSAGADTIGAQLTTACIDAIRMNPGNVEAAWRHVGVVFGHDLIKSLIGDMNPAPRIPARPTIDFPISQPMPPLAQTKRDAPIDFKITSGTEVRFDQPPIVKPYKPRVIPAERLEKRRELQNIVRSKYKTSSGIPWSDVSWHSLSAMSRDGDEAAALLAAGPANVPNDGRTVADVIGIKRADDIIAKVRA